VVGASTSPCSYVDANVVCVHNNPGGNHIDQTEHPLHCIFYQLRNLSTWCGFSWLAQNLPLGCADCSVPRNTSTITRLPLKLFREVGKELAESILHAYSDDGSVCYSQSRRDGVRWCNSVRTRFGLVIREVCYEGGLEGLFGKAHGWQKSVLRSGTGRSV
jgi:hypothetical protein